MIQKLVDDPNISEILINDWQSVYIEQNGKLKKEENIFDTPIAYNSLQQEILMELNSDLSLKEAFVSGLWKDFRVQMVSSHISNTSTLLSLRRIKHKRWSLEELVQLKSLKKTEKKYLEKQILDKQNILVVGATSSGKTSLLNALLNAIPNNERMVIIEDLDELHLPNAASTKMISYEVEEDLIQHVSMEDLVKVSLRLRPDRIVIGEVRGAEAKNLVLALSSGHRGSVSSLHANSASEALERLEVLTQLGAPQWNIKTVRRLIYHAFDTVIVLKKDSKGHRHVDEIAHLNSIEENGIVVDPAMLDFLSEHKNIGRYNPLDFA